MKLYNTASRMVEEFKPINEGKVNLFVCGPTVYDYPHLGHAKNYIQFDFVARYLRYREYEVTYIQNITDIDDKIIKRSQERGVSWDSLAREYETIFLDDMKSLHISSVTTYARATDFIPQIVNQVKVLLKKGFAYQITDGIYYEVSKFKHYGKLSGRTELREEDAVSRVDENSEKRGWNDFCLWKNFKEGEPFWETELGKGRPGWHIEDTAITESFFGSQYDVHGGAVDLIFPHHEAEIAQMEAASGKEPLVRYWMHIGFLNINSEKMSKSKGNFRTIRQALENYNYRVLRYLFLSSHYRSALDFTDTVLEKAENSLKRISEYFGHIDKDYENTNEKELIEALRMRVNVALDDDFDTPKAFAAIYEFIRQSNVLGKPGKYIYEYLLEINQVFDILDLEEEMVPENVLELAKQRQDARNSKNWAESDRLREEIKKLGYLVEDISGGSKIKKC